MKRVAGFVLFLFLPALCLFGQDTVYARKVIKQLTSRECYGRGYLNNGLDVAAKYICSELKGIGAKALFPSGYYQPFSFNVNTFPGKVSVKINGKALKPGADFIISPESSGLKGKFKMQRKDSATFVSENERRPLVLSFRKKLTFGVATSTAPYCQAELLDKNVSREIHTAEVDIKSEFRKDFTNKNICAVIDGKENSDSMIVFSAHYDHLGGLGRKTFFPGANDNASGVSVLLNLAKYYSEFPPKYRTLFIFFAGEEAGLMGSKYFVDNNTVDLGKIKFLVNLDLLGTGDDGIMVVNGAIQQREFELMNSINNEQKLVKEIRKRGKARNSDHYWFTEAGVPAFFIYTLGGTASYHDIYDTAGQLPLTDYVDVFRLLTGFISRL
jgi:aminopeptidase YwaD